MTPAFPASFSSARWGAEPLLETADLSWSCSAEQTAGNLDEKRNRRRSIFLHSAVQVWKFLCADQKSELSRAQGLLDGDPRWDILIIMVSKRLTSSENYNYQFSVHHQKWRNSNSSCCFWDFFFSFFFPGVQQGDLDIGRSGCHRHHDNNPSSFLQQ